MEWIRVCQNAARHVKTRQVRQLHLESLVTGNFLSKQREQAGKQAVTGSGSNPLFPSTFLGPRQQHGRDCLLRLVLCQGRF